MSSLNLIVNGQANPMKSKIPLQIPRQILLVRGEDSSKPRVSSVRAGKVLTFLFLLLRCITNLTAMLSSVASHEYPRTLLPMRCLTDSSVSPDETITFILSPPLSKICLMVPVKVPSANLEPFILLTSSVVPPPTLSST